MKNEQPFIRRIEGSENLDGETKLRALCEIDLIQRGKIHCVYNPTGTMLINSFAWYATPSGHEFWAFINHAITT